jgi:hypothetical protein
MSTPAPNFVAVCGNANLPLNGTNATYLNALKGPGVALGPSLTPADLKERFGALTWVRHTVANAIDPLTWPVMLGAPLLAVLPTPFRHHGRTHPPARQISIGWRTASASATPAPPTTPGGGIITPRPAAPPPAPATTPTAAPAPPPDGPPPTPPGVTPYSSPSSIPARRPPRPSPSPALTPGRPPYPPLAAPALAPRFPDTCERGPSSVPPLRLSWSSDPRLRGPHPLWGWHGPRLSTICPAGPRACPL